MGNNIIRFCCKTNKELVSLFLPQIKKNIRIKRQVNHKIIIFFFFNFLIRRSNRSVIRNCRCHNDYITFFIETLHCLIQFTGIPNINHSNIFRRGQCFRTTYQNHVSCFYCSGPGDSITHPSAGTISYITYRINILFCPTRAYDYTLPL